MEYFYRLSSLFALKSFLSSQCAVGNSVLREVSVFFGIFFFIIGSKANSQKMAKTNFWFCKTFRPMQYISLILFPVLKSSGLANEAE